MTARTDNYDEIVRVVQLYVDGFNHNEVEKFKEAFDENAWIFYIDAAGKLHKNLISEDFQKWATPPSRSVVGRFVSVTQVGDAAAVQLSFNSVSDKSAGWIDFHNLLKSTASGRSRIRPRPTAAVRRFGYLANGRHTLTVSVRQRITYWLVVSCTH